MAVSLTANDTIDPSSDFSDSLQGGGTGISLGQVVSGSFAPVTNKALNQGKQDVYIIHDAVTDEITDVKTFLQQFGVGTGFTYGGQRTAAGDYTDIKNLGNASGSSKNNADGNSGGLWIDMDWDSNDTTRFDVASFPAVVKIYGDSGTDGIDLASAFTMESDAMVYDSGGETAASSPVDGSIGKSGDTVLGDNAHCALRVYLPSSHTDGGYFQVEWVIVYSYTA